MTLNSQSDYMTAVQRACAKARKSGKEADLTAAANALLDPVFDSLPERVQDDLRACYNDAAAFVLGVGGG